MSSSIANTPQSSIELLESLKTQIQDASPKKQLPILPQLLALQAPGYQVLMAFLLEAKQQALPTVSTGRALQLLHQVQEDSVKTFLSQEFSAGVVSLPATCQVDYSELQTALIQQDFELADRLTLQKMCELAGPMAVKRKWLYFTEVNTFPIIDLQTLDQLWFVYSEGKFGFSCQREIWLGVGKNWEKLWPKISWKENNLWTRYPGEFVWNLEAPVGHLPLTNQLRGVRVMDALMNHPAWESAT
ncbi:MAG: GUN4 domain-containing protein [Leptolyngbya sp. SIO1D8]|nr:GUN4 domain-containing protein [Leptolyngbya sp. SIO1D8]